MNRINEHLLSYLGSHGACTASELSAAMKISQPTLSRAITSLGQQRIVRMGRARSTRYARRSERPGNECPLYLIDESGQAVHLGVLYELSRGEWHLQRDLVLWVARRCTGLTLAELGRKAGGMDYAAVTMAVRRFPLACKRDKTLARLTEKVFKMVEM